MNKMFARYAGWLGTASVIVLAGCGRAATDGQETLIVTTFERPASAKTGVIVDGRWYPAGEEPMVEITPPPATPQAGRGHLRMLVNLKKLSGFTTAITLNVSTGGRKESVMTIRWQDDLRRRGIQTEYTVENLAPGEYVLELKEFNASGGFIRSHQSIGKVVADSSQEARI
jgi:hypothetical protein